MIEISLQAWGGLFYLLNKVCFSRAERADSQLSQQKWKLRAWVAYLTGLPPWVLVFVTEHNWIAAAVQSSCAPAMIIGLSAARQGYTQLHESKWLDYLAKLMIVTGLALSLYDFGGLITINQFLESGIAATFLIGTYLLAKSKPQGYLWIAVGNVCSATLMMRQEYYLLMTQQVVSLCVMIDICRVQGRRTTYSKKETNNGSGNMRHDYSNTANCNDRCVLHEYRKDPARQSG